VTVQPLPWETVRQAPLREPVAIDVEAISIPAGEYTGDFYTTTRVGDDFWFAVGDVAGKGLHAALIVAIIQEHLEEIISSNPDSNPAEVVARLDRAVRGEMPGNRFATLVVGRIDASLGLEIVNGGHCEPIILRGGGEMIPIPSNGPVIGILPCACWSPRRFQLRAGDRLVIYTDGILEALSPRGEEFGATRTHRLLVEACRKRYVEEILATVDEFARGRQHDDLTVFTIAIRPVT